jgi:hypothetical protein
MKKKSLGKYWPQDYSNFKVIKIWAKKRSPQLRIWATNDPDGWFIDILHVGRKSKEVKEEEGWIIPKDLDDWSSWYKILGWEEIKEEDI